ncbi:MAG: glycoside hydrolase family 38 C-terminal domain-containing protein [Kiritimatiellae bacterium]|nr:glycoside hydrolase family 38 C-terminal domain-containing protein [Kiritimatiellia bacterium]
MSTLFYVKVVEVPLSGFVTSEQLTPAQAVRGRFKPMPAGTSWGAKWEYAWFRGAAKLPAEARGERIVLGANPPGQWGNEACGEGRVLVNGRETGGADWAHAHLLLAAQGVPGTKYEILVERYAGHGAMECGGGPCPDGREMVPEAPARQRTVSEMSVGIWQEEIYQAWLDAQTLLELRDKLDQTSLRVAEIDEGLRQFTLAVDLELPRREMLATVRAGRRILKPLLNCRNGSTSPLLYCYGHSHIDVAWLWPLQETERKCARTFGTQLGLMEQYPEYKFLQSQPHLYRMTKRLYPELYARIRAAIRRRQWIPEGGMWVEADTNISGGESLIRQFLHGKRFFKAEFGIDSELMWLPDVFGYSGAMPQIMAGCGIKYFSTQKIFWNYNGGETFPHNTFWWEGIDGTRLLSHFHNDYNSQTNPAVIWQRWSERVQKDGIVSRLVPFGYGDGGGGPTRDHLEYLRRQKNLEGMPRTTIASPLDFFHAEEKRRASLPVYVGELYFQAHRGTYTTQAKTKQGNRRSEFALREAELWGAAAIILARFRYPAVAMDEAWKGVLLNQFHDIIPGSSIHRVYEEAEALYARVLDSARKTAGTAVRALLSRDRNSVTALNSLNWERTALVPLPKGFAGVEAGGAALPVQTIAGLTYAEAVLPSCGWLPLRKSGPAKSDNRLRVDQHHLENEFLRLKLNARGEITSLFDKQAGCECAAGPLNELRLYKDVPRWFDAWDIDSQYALQPVSLGGQAEVTVAARGPLVAVLKVKRKLNHSLLVQEIRLRRHSRRIEFHTRIEWREKHKLLKAAFPFAIHANEAVHEIQFGHLKRPNHASRQFDADRFEVCNQKWTALCEENRGVAVLNDCKYGVNARGGSINLTLLRSPLAPDMTADQGTQEFTYACYVWNGSFAESALVREAYELNAPIMTASGFAPAQSLFTLDAGNIILEAVKPAEDGSGDMILRLYESKRMATRCRLGTSLPVRKARAADMLEATGATLPLRSGRIDLKFRPFEIKTLRLSF